MEGVERGRQKFVVVDGWRRRRKRRRRRRRKEEVGDRALDERLKEDKEKSRAEKRKTRKNAKSLRRKNIEERGRSYNITFI